MPDLSHVMGLDISFSANGDLLTADSLDLSQQRVLRRLVTNAGDYIWHPDYGAGLPQMIGLPVTVEAVQGIVQGQMFLETSVVQNPLPTINVVSIPNGLSADIRYTESDSLQPAGLSFTVNP